MITHTTQPPRINYDHTHHTTTENQLLDWEGIKVVDREYHRRGRQGVPQKEKTGSPTGEDRESHRRRRQGIPQKEKTREVNDMDKDQTR